MKKKILALCFYPLVCSILLSLTGCHTMQKLIKHSKLDVQTKMSQTIFLDPVDDDKRTVLLQVRNTTDKKGLSIESHIKKALEEKGYRVVRSPKDATFMIQANILQVGKSELEDPFSTLTAGYGSTFEGIAAGALVGSAVSNFSPGGAVVGGLVGGVGSSVLDAAVDVVTYSMVTDLQVSEKVDGAIVTESSEMKLQQGSGHKTSSWSEKKTWKKYQTRIVSAAKQVNLKFEEAEEELTQGLVQSISGLL